MGKSNRSKDQKKEVETKLLQVPRCPLDIHREIGALASWNDMRKTDYVVKVLREHVEEVKRRERR